ncbi:MAG: 5'-methylthioadenosine/adenosylhomocysteine nucleosidase [Oscillospiraceae bacterium]|nr:5'-methylthioadenosine/adenosylhomocysteine nucleosidase [Oscillospiraceae bacterium]
MKLGIIGAMDVEVATLKQLMQNKSERTVAGAVYCEGILEGLSVVVVQCGVGKVNAALCVQALCDLFMVTHIVNTGVAGSLNASLDIGDLVISSDAIYHDFDCHVLNDYYVVGQVPGLSVRAFPADKMLTELAYSVADKACPGHTAIGTIASGDQFVCGKEQKQQIVDDTNALCTEMEGAAIAHGAWRNGVPFVIIRAISDKADDSAEMDYPTFEAIAAKKCAEITRAMASALANLVK